MGFQFLVATSLLAFTSASVVAEESEPSLTLSASSGLHPELLEINTDLVEDRRMEAADIWWAGDALEVMAKTHLKPGLGEWEKGLGLPKRSGSIPQCDTGGERSGKWVGCSTHWTPRNCPSGYNHVSSGYYGCCSSFWHCFGKYKWCEKPSMDCTGSWLKEQSKKGPVQYFREQEPTQRGKGFHVACIDGEKWLYIATSTGNVFPTKIQRNDENSLKWLGILGYGNTVNC